MTRIFIVGIVVLLFLAIVGASSDGWSGVITILPWIVILVLWLALLGGGQAWIGAWHIRRNNRHLVAGQQHSLSDAGYRLRCGLIESTIPWAGFERLVETRDFFLAYPHKSGAYYLPKRSLTAEQTRQARELFKLHGGDRATVLAA